MSNALPHSVMGNVVLQSFINWGSKDSKYKMTYDKLIDSSFLVIRNAFEEMPRFAPGVYEIWWATEHMRFTNKISGRQQRLIHELLYIFLTKYCRGTLKNGQTTKKIKQIKIKRETAII